MEHKNYKDAITALVDKIQNEAKSKEDAEKQRLEAVKAEAEAVKAEAESHMRPLLDVFTSHPEIHPVAGFHAGQESDLLTRSFWKAHGDGCRKVILAVKVDPATCSYRSVYLLRDRSGGAYLSTCAVVIGSAPADKADALIPLALELCAMLVTNTH